MDQELLVRQIMQEVMKNMQGSAAACECESKVTVEDYPLREKTRINQECFWKIFK